MVDGAVRCEPVSASNSLIIRENTGNFRDFGRLWADSKREKPCLLSGFRRNSLLKETGNFETRTGNCCAGTGNFLRITGKPLSDTTNKTSRVDHVRLPIARHDRRSGRPLRNQTVPIFAHCMMAGDRQSIETANHSLRIRIATNGPRKTSWPPNIDRSAVLTNAVLVGPILSSD
jgi:hypothetical protein